MRPKVDSYIRNARSWKEEMTALREIALDSGLTEELKWGKPCYTSQGNNIAIIQPFKERCGFMFFKGSLLKDHDGLLEAPGSNSQSAKRLMFSTTTEIRKLKPKLRAFIQQAIKLEAAGIKVPAKKTPEVIPVELTDMFRKVAGLKKAFEQLTPGRQRAYILHFSAAKQATTRISRIEKCVPMILEGKGMRD